MCPSWSIRLQTVSVHEPSEVVYQHAEDGLNMLRAATDIAWRTAEPPELLQWWDRNQCLMSQLHHSTLRPMPHVIASSHHPEARASCHSLITAPWGLCLMSQPSEHPEAHVSCHSSTTAPWGPVLDGIRLSYASFFSLPSTATSSSTKTEFSSLSFLTRGRNSLDLRTERWGP